MKFLKHVIWIALLGWFVYNVVDEKTRLKFDNGIEFQKISLEKARQSAYLFIWEFLGAHEEELAKQKEEYRKEMETRERILNDKRDEAGRSPAFDPHKKNFDHLIK